MIFGVPKERAPGEKRVSLIPDGVVRLLKAGHEVLVEEGAGDGSYFFDETYRQAGAKLLESAQQVYAGADVILKVQGPSDAAEDDPAKMGHGKGLVGVLKPLGNPEGIRRLSSAHLTAFSLDSLPRSTRTQSMDALSSMSTVAGYRATVTASVLSGKLFPLLMTAAGTVKPAQVLVLGAGVAGLQAIATARRLGAVVRAFDTRPVVREQVESLGASFLTLPLPTEGEQDAFGYAKRMEEDLVQVERELLAAPIASADVVITTAMIPGEKAPVLITQEMVEAMAPGSVIMDLAAEGGGNCALTLPGERRVWKTITIDAPLDLPSQMARESSHLYSKNMLSFLEYLLSVGLQKTDQEELEFPREDEIIKSTLLTHRGEIVHERTRERVLRKEGDAGVS